MSEITAEPEVAEVGDDAVVARRPVKRRVFQLPDGTRVPVSEFQSTAKIDRDVLIHYLGERQVVVPGIGKKKPKVEWVTTYDPASALRDKPLEPGFDSPLCKQCALHEHGCRTPFMPYQGADQPLITIIFDGVSRAEDMQGRLGNGGSAERIRRIIDDNSAETGVTSADIRWVPMTRCASWSKKQLDLKSRGNWCRYHVIDDLMLHTPALIIPIGTKALGLLSHKSNAQEWSGRMLTYRGWPDDWLMNAKYMLPRVLHQPPTPKGKPPVVLPPDHSGHPLFGQAPDWRIPMVPLQSPRLIDMAQSDYVYKRWERQLLNALKQAKQGVKVLSYTREWYRFTTDIELIEDTLNYLLQHPGLKVCYDTETTGLRPWAADAAIVSIMMRWNDPATGAPRSIGFPWQYTNSPEHPDYEISPLLQHIPRLKSLVWKVLTRATLVGHNLTFDMLYTYATFWRKHLVGWADRAINLQRDRVMVSLANACRYDTWHMAFALRQARGSLGLEALAYQWVPEFAGYEEEMTLLIGLHYEAMHPAAGVGGHYLNCAKDYWPNYVTPYVMGDVEVCYRAQNAIAAKLETSNVYAFPLAHPTKRGRFRDFVPQDRKFIYEKIMSPAASVLMKMMARGMFIDTKKLLDMEDRMPKQIMKLREDLKKVDPRILAWCETNERTVSKEDAAKIAKGEPVKKWELDLEDKGQLKDLLFKVLDLPVTRFTKSGKKELGEDIKKAHDMLARVIVDMKPELADNPKDLEKAVQEELRKVAAIDKFTLNKICCQFENLRPLQKYRKAFKLYSTYVRPLRNIFTTGLDKKARTADAHLCFDQCVHAQFLLTGTRGGRLSSRNPNLQQLPRDGEVKSMFTSRFGARGCIYQSDLSQIELRLLAAACGDAMMCKAYEDDIDLHSLTTSHIFKVPYEHFEKSHMKKLQEDGKSKEAKELEEKRSIGKCVDPLTLVSVNGRISRIGDVHAGREDDTFYPLSGVTVQGPSGQIPAKNFYYNGVKKRFLVCSRRGLVVCSETHPFLLANGELKKSVDLKKGDVLASPTALDVAQPDSLPVISFSPFDTAPRSNNFSVTVDADLAYVLGMFYGDGISNLGEISISTGGTPEFFEWQDTIAESARKVGFVPDIVRTEWDSAVSGAKIVKTGPTAGQAINGAYGRVGLGSTRVNDLFVQLGAVKDTKKRERTLTVPTWLFNAGYAVKIAFLAGWLDTDGSCARQGTLSGITKSWVLAQDIMVLLGTCGIGYLFEPAWNKTYERFYYRINLSVESSWEHFNGKLRYSKKRDALRKPKFVYKYKRPNEVVQVIPLDDAPLVDLEVDTEDHLFICNTATCRNTVNFLTGYGGGAYGLQNVLAGKDIYRSPEECQGIIDLFFDTYPALREWLQQYKRFILDTQCAVSLFGRVRVFEEVLGNDEEAKAKALRAGCNHVIQSTASDMMLVALFCIENMMRDEGLESILVSTVHDSLLIDCVREELPQVHSIVMSVLNNFPAVFKAVFGDDYDTSWLSIPFAGDSELGLSYLSMNKIGKNPDWNALLAA